MYNMDTKMFKNEKLRRIAELSQHYFLVVFEYHRLSYIVALKLIKSSILQVKRSTSY